MESGDPATAGAPHPSTLRAVLPPTPDAPLPAALASRYRASAATGVPVKLGDAVRATWARITIEGYPSAGSVTEARNSGHGWEGRLAMPATRGALPRETPHAASPRRPLGRHGHLEAPSATILE